MIPGAFPVMAGEPPILAKAIEFAGHTSLGSGTTYTVPGVSFGAAVNGRNRKGVVALLTYRSASNILVNVTGATIDGIAATELFSLQVTAATSLRVRFVALGANLKSASGDIVFTDDVALTPTLSLFSCINLDATTAIAPSARAGSTITTLSATCPAGGGIIARGVYGYSGGSGPASSDNFANLVTIGSGVAGAVFASAQTGLDTSYNPQPDRGLTRCEAVVFSLAKNPLI